MGVFSNEMKEALGESQDRRDGQGAKQCQHVLCWKRCDSYFSVAPIQSADGAATHPLLLTPMMWQQLRTGLIIEL